MMLNGWLKNTTDMETNFNFKSQICTSREQSERLLALGLKKETADMMHYAYIYTAGGCFIEEHLRNYHIRTKKDNVWVEISNEHRIPAWSLSRLIEMYVERYISCSMNLKNLTCEWIINEIEIHIKEGYFNKEYLV